MNATDMELLEQFTHMNAEDAFASVVHRYLPLVFSAAVRQLRSPDLAKEVAQSVFLELAQHATQLRKDTVLSAWLYEVTRRKAIDLLRRETRRHHREQTAMEMNSINTNDAPWREIEPVLDEAMETLEPIDRSAVLLRYFENKSLRDVGHELGISENAAQKRISKAIDRLCQFFRGKGINASSAVLISSIAANAVETVPIQMASMIAHAGIVAVNSATTSTTTTVAIKTITMTIAQKSIFAAALIATAGFGLYETSVNSSLRKEIKNLQTKLEAASSTKTEGALAPSTNDLIALKAENDRLRKNQNELLQLRAELTRLRIEDRPVASVSDESTSLQASAAQWARRVTKLKEKLASMPSANVPELKLLTHEDWLSSVKGRELESEDDYRHAFSQLRNSAHNKFAAMAQPALGKFMKENDMAMPTEMSQLLPYFGSNPIETDILDRFAILPADTVKNVIMGGDWIITQVSAVDEEIDNRIVIGPRGFGSTNWKPAQSESQSKDIKLLENAYKAFSNAKGQAPIDPSQLEPYLRTSEEHAAYQRLLEAQAQVSAKK